MNHHCLIHISDDWHEDKNVASIFHDEYGEPNHVGKQLAKYLLDTILCNSNDVTIDRYALGMGCLAAQYIVMVKKVPGKIYLVDKDFRDSEDWFYDITCHDMKIRVRVTQNFVELFIGSIVEFATYCDDYISIYTNDVDLTDNNIQNDNSTF